MSDFDMSSLLPGDMVFWYSNPANLTDPAVGWISQKPGAKTATLLVWGSGTGFVEKPSVRHKDDEFWRESEAAQAWHKWGCFELHPNTAALKTLPAIATKMKLMAASSKKGE